MTDATEKGKKVGIQTYPNAHAGGEYRTKAAKGGRIKAAHGWGRTNLLDEARRIRTEPQTRNVRAEEARVGGELSRGFKGGGGAKKGKKGGGIIKGNKGMGVAK